jgi:hypothetical protein
MIDIDAALTDNKLLGAALGDPSTWQTWQCVLKAAFCLPLSKQERHVFQVIAGDRKAPAAPVKELWAVAGRQSGKSRIAALISAYLATFVDHRSKLAPGEIGYVLTLSPTLDQSQIIFRYALAFLESSPILRQKIVDANATEIRLENNVVISTHPASFRTVRGRTLLAVVCDESAYWRSDESASPDREVYRAILPSLARTNGMLIGISSPYRRVGLLYEKHRDHFGVDGDVLVIQAATPSLNPTINTKMIAQARADDPSSAAAEWDAQFRSDLSQFLADETIDAVVNHSRPAELPPQAGNRYFCFVDASAGRHDHFTMCIGHKDGDAFVCDVLRGAKPPFDPASIAAEYASLAKQYKITTVVGDNFSGEWVAAAFKKAGVDYRRSKQPRSILYLESMPAFMRGAVSIPDHSRLLRELRLLERRTSPSGKDTIDHGKNGSDDYANSLCGCIAITLKEPRELLPPIGLGGKVFANTGMVVSDSITPIFDRMKPPPPPPTENDRLHQANLKRQHEEMRDRVEGPLRPNDAVRKRMEELRAARPAVPSIGTFHSKLLGGAGR